MTKTKLIDAWLELKCSGTAWLEFGFALAMLASGLWIGYPFNHAFNGESPFYRAIRDAMSPPVMGVILVLCGAFQMGAYLSRSRRLRITAAQVNAAAWLFLALILIFDDLTGWAPIVTSWFCIFETVVFVLLLTRKNVVILSE